MVASHARFHPSMEGARVTQKDLLKLVDGIAEVIVEVRRRLESRFDRHEQRIAQLEKQLAELQEGKQ